MKTIKIKKNIFEKNDEVAIHLRTFFKKRRIFTVNLLGSPGAGKTSILEKVIQNLNPEINCAIIEGDLFTDRDAKRLEKCGTRVIQINTEGVCHLDANMVKKAVKKLNLKNIDLLIIENVGNLVCTASYDLGENIKATVFSVPEGSDKLLKYPHIFQKAEIMIINKIDLVKYTNFDRKKIVNDLKKMNKNIRIFNVSCETNEGIKELCIYLEKKTNG